MWISQFEANKRLIRACQQGSLEQAKFYLTSPKLKFRAKINTTKDRALVLAAGRGHLDMVKYLLSSPDLTEHSNLGTNGCEAFRVACEGGHLPVVQYMLTEAKKRPNINANNSYGLCMAAKNGHSEVVKYLLSSPELKYHADISANNYQAVKLACDNHKCDILNYFLENFLDVTHNNYQVLDWVISCGGPRVIHTVLKEVSCNDTISSKLFHIFKGALISKYRDNLETLIFVNNLPYSSEVQSLLQKDDPFYEQVRKWFLQRDFNKQLGTNLSTKPRYKVKTKI